MASARLAPARTSPSIRHELVGERTGHGGDRAVERLLEAEAGLDADHEQVEDVGQLDLDLVLPLVDPAVEDGVGSEDQQRRRSAEAGRSACRPVTGRTK